MARNTASIQAEIDAIEARLSSADSFVRSAGSLGTNIAYEDRAALERRLDQLYNQLDVASGYRFVRGRLDGLR
jgi:hypothetical protein